MNIQLSERVQQIKVSPTLAISARAATLKAQGSDIISLSAGEPDFDTPENIKQAATQAINNGFTKYTAVDGIAELKQAVVSKLKRDNDLSYQADQILVSTGAKQSLFNLTQALLNPGDEVIIPVPYWVSYPDMVLLAGAKPVTIDTDINQHYKISAEQLERTITTNTRLLLLNSPSNPSGVVYTKAELTALAEVLLRHPQIIIASDDIYEHIYWHTEPFVNILNACPALYERAIIINGVSKAYAMTGWRIGYAAGPKILMAAMKKIQSQSTSCPNAIAQKATVAALNDEQTKVTAMISAFKQRHDIVYQRLSAIDGIKVIPSDGTFYTFPNIQAILNAASIKDDIEFAESLLNETGVALVPGTAFGCPGSIRLSFAINPDTLKDALTRIEQYIQAVAV